VHRSKAQLDRWSFAVQKEKLLEVKFYFGADDPELFSPGSRQWQCSADASTITRIVCLLALADLIGLASERRTGFSAADIVLQNFLTG
jgi:hypothetical protein